jgi:hypothetical protein
MERYFFHITDVQRTFKDDVGTTFATPAAAEGHAVVIAGELAGDKGWEGFSVVVEGKNGEITRVSIHLR